VRQLHESWSPMVLTVNGKAEVVVKDAGAYQRLVELAARADREEAVAAFGKDLRTRKPDESNRAARR